MTVSSLVRVGREEESLLGCLSRGNVPGGCGGGVHGPTRKRSGRRTLRTVEGVTSEKEEWCSDPRVRVTGVPPTHRALFSAPGSGDDFNLNNRRTTHGYTRVSEHVYWSKVEVVCGVLATGLLLSLRVSPPSSVEPRGRGSSVTRTNGSRTGPVKGQVTKGRGTAGRYVGSTRGTSGRWYVPEVRTRTLVTG